MDQVNFHVMKIKRILYKNENREIVLNLTNIADSLYL